MKKSVSVVIPNYNGKELLKQNLPSVAKALKKADCDYEIIVADDNSKDESTTFLKENYPQIIVITSQENQGFSANINKGLRAATKELVLALNSDVALDEDYFAEQWKHFKDPKTFGVAAALKDPVNDKITDGAKVARQNFFGIINPNKNAMASDNSPLVSFFLSGANALIDREKLKQINYFNEIYSPFYREDTDLGLTAWRMGWQSFFEPKAYAYHKTSSTINSLNKKKYVRFISKRNKLVFHFIHLQGLKRVLFFTSLIFDVFTRWITLDFVFYRSLFAFLKMIPKIKQSIPDLKLKPTQGVLKEIFLLQKKDNLKYF